MLILVRHGESSANARRLLVGRTDAGLTENGREQAVSVRRLLTAPVSALRTSPLRRARDTAALLDLGLPAQVDDRWIEVDYGEYECQALGEVPADVWRAWRESPDFRPPGGETLAEVDARVNAACDELFAAPGSGARAEGGDVLVVSHVTPIKAAVAWALGATGALSWRLHLQTASVTRIGWGNGVPVLHGFNEVAPDREGTAQSPRAESPDPATAGEVPAATLAALRPPPGAPEHPVHRRTIDMEVFERRGHLVVIGTLHDQRPWASGALGPRSVHRMELGIVVRQSDLVIVDAAANMHTFPHAECPTIEGSFADLIGLSISRGYTNAVQKRFGRERGCSHLEFLARALGPVVIQALSGAAARRLEEGGDEIGILAGGGLHWLTNTCHLWAEGGIGAQKVAAGWRPAKDTYPAPSLVEIRRRGVPAPE